MMMREVSVVFMGTPVFAVPSLDALMEARAPAFAEASHFAKASRDRSAGLRVIGVVTQPDKPSGRHRQVQKSAVAKRADALGLPVFTPKGLKKEENRAFLRELTPDLIVVVAYGKLLPKEVLDLPRFGAVNVHFSLLPRWRGPAPVPAAILAGDAETGVTIMKLDEGMDTGPILAQELVSIVPDDTTAVLLPRLAEIGARLLVATLSHYLSGNMSPVPQDETRASVCALLKKEDGLIDWAQSAEQISHMVRAYDPWPRAYTWWNGRRLIIRRATAVPVMAGVRPELPGAAAATVVNDAGAILVLAGSSALQLREVQLESRTPQSIEQFVRGYPQFVGAWLVGHAGKPEAVVEIRMTSTQDTKR